VVFFPVSSLRLFHCSMMTHAGPSDHPSPVTWKVAFPCDGGVECRQKPRLRQIFSPISDASPCLAHVKLWLDPCLLLVKGRVGMQAEADVGRRHREPTLPTSSGMSQKKNLLVSNYSRFYNLRCYYPCACMVALVGVVRLFGTRHMSTVLPPIPPRHVAAVSCRERALPVFGSCCRL